MKKRMKLALIVMMLSIYLVFPSISNVYAQVASNTEKTATTTTTTTTTATAIAIAINHNVTVSNVNSTTAAIKLVASKMKQTPKEITTKKTTVTKKSTIKKPTVKKSVAKKSIKISASKKRTSRKKNSRSASLSALASNAKVELLDWWTSASRVFARGETATIYDIRSGRSFNVVRTMGTNHADVEAKTADDTDIIRNIWGGYSWETRPVLVIVDGRRLAASMSAMPHAGLDSKPAYVQVSDRSGGFGSGENLDVIKNNGMDGHMDIHFLHSTRHKDGKSDPKHQASVMIAAGR